MLTTVANCRRLGLAVTTALLVACGAPKSSTKGGAAGAPVPTNKMTLYLAVESTDPPAAVVRVNLHDSKLLPTYYRLDGGDFLRACVNGVCRSLADNDSITTPDYVGSFTYQPGIDYVVSFHRQQAADAPDSRVVLPPPFSIVTPADGQQVTDGDTVQVTWMPTGASAHVALTYAASCTVLSGSPHILTGTLSDDSNADGGELVSIDEIVDLARSDSSTVTRCSIDVTVRHELTGQVDPAFDRGLARGIVSRKINLDYVPR